MSPDVMALAGELASERTKPEWRTFSLELNSEQQEIRSWAHEFASSVIRPAASEWDEREETPWPVIQEAAKVGLYGLDSSVNLFIDPSGLLLPIVSEEVFWGDAGIGMSIMGTGLASSAIFSNGTPEQWNTWLPRCYGTADDVQVAAFCSSEPDAGSDVAAIRTKATYDEKTNEWVVNGQKAWATNGGIADVHVVVATVDPSLGSKGQAAFVVPKSEVTGLELAAEALQVHAERAVADYLEISRTPIGLDELLQAISRLSFDPQLERSQITIYLEGGRNPALREPVGRVVDGYRRVAEQLLETIGLPGAKEASPAFVALFDGFTLQRLARPDAPPTADQLVEALYALLVGFLARKKERREILKRLSPR